MKSTTISPTLTHLTRFGLMNAYLVREDDGLTLIDTTIAGAADDLLGAVAHIGLPLRRVLLTHAHGDHMGSLDSIAGRVPSLEVLISARDNRLLHKDLSLDPNEPQGKIKGSTPGAKTTPTRLLEHGDRVGSLLCVSTPGHTPGHMSFLDTRDGTFFAGDALVTLGGRTEVVTNPPWWFPLPKVATWHPPTAVASAAALLQPGVLPLEPTRIAPGHGPVLASTRATLLSSIDRASSKLR